MRSTPKTEPKTNIDIRTQTGKIIREAILAGKEYQRNLTPENQSRYDHLFEEVHKHFQPKVKGWAKAKIQPFNGTMEDAEEITQDIFLEIDWKLPHFK